MLKKRSLLKMALIGCYVLLAQSLQIVSNKANSGSDSQRQDIANSTSRNTVNINTNLIALGNDPILLSSKINFNQPKALRNESSMLYGLENYATRIFKVTTAKNGVFNSVS